MNDGFVLTFVLESNTLTLVRQSILYLVAEMLKKIYAQSWETTL